MYFYKVITRRAVNNYDRRKLYLIFFLVTNYIPILIGIYREVCLQSHCEKVHIIKASYYNYIMGRKLQVPFEYMELN